MQRTIVEDGIDPTLMNLLKIYSEHKPNSNNLQITLDNRRYYMTNIVSVIRLFEKSSYLQPSSISCT